MSMSTARIDVHVDELFDGARTGTLSTGEAARLSAHCRVCVACRVELGWVGDGLHTELATDADRLRGARAVEALLGGVGGADDIIGTSQRAEPARRSVRVRAPRISGWQAAALVCVGMLMASATAALYTEVRAWQAREQAAEREAERAREVERSRMRSRLRKGQGGGNASAGVSAGSEEAVEPAPPPVVIDQATVAPPEPGAARTSTPVAAPVPSRAVLAERLFARANAERTAGELGQALSSYEALDREFAETRSALAARISRAELLLRQLHQPAQALAAYRSYLAAAPHGALAEEARVGVASCLRQLGQDDEERRAWQALLERYPGSLHAARAQARLRALSP